MLQLGRTALYLSALWDRVEVVKTLLKHNAAVDIRDKVTKLLGGVLGVASPSPSQSR